MAFPREWLYYAPIVIQNVQVTGGPHVDFPVYLQEECLPDVMLTTGDDQASLASGADIRFTSDAAGGTELPFHLVEYTQNGNPALASANIWVKVPSIVNGADTTIYIWWGNPDASAYAVDDTYGQYNVWDANVARWMLDDDQDATEDNRDLNDTNVTFVGAKIDNGMRFDADGAEVVSFSWITGVSVISFEFWVNVDAARVFGERIFHMLPFELVVDDSNPNKFKIIFQSYWTGDEGQWNVDTEYDTGTWYHILVTYDGSLTTNDPTFTVNGAVVAGGDVTEIQAPTGTLWTGGGTGLLGKDGTGNRLHGDIDEFFITTGSEVSSNWGVSAWENQNDPTNFAIEGTVVPVNRAQLTPSGSTRAYQLVDPLTSLSIRAYQLVDPLTSFSIRAYQSGGLIPKFAISPYQGSSDRGFLIPKYDILTKSGYRITAVDTTTEVETELGFIDHEASPLELTGVTLADGTYDIRIYLQGFLWLDARLFDTIRVTVVAGVVSANLPPPVENLVYEQISDYTRFIWTWSQTFGCLDPDSFGVWISTAAPPAIGGTPDYTIVAETPRNYALSHEQGAVDTIWVAVAAITGTTRGPESRVTMLAPSSALSSPTIQIADEEEII